MNPPSKTSTSIKSPHRNEAPNVDQLSKNQNKSSTAIRTKKRKADTPESDAMIKKKADFFEKSENESFNKNLSISNYGPLMKSKLINYSRLPFSQGVPYIAAHNNLDPKILHLNPSFLFPRTVDEDSTRINLWEDNAKHLTFYAYFDPDKAPTPLGTISDLKSKGFENDILLDPLLITSPQDKEKIVRSQALYYSLCKSGMIEGDHSAYVAALEKSPKFIKFRDEQEELLINASSSKSHKLLEMLLRLKTNPNSFSSNHGVWAINVARRHHREENVKLLEKFGADPTVEDQDPF